MPKKQMPLNWEPPVPAWQAKFGADVTETVFAYFGCQRAEGSASGPYAQRLTAAFSALSAPAFVTRATYVDSSNFRNDVFIAYWPGRAAYNLWWQDSDLEQWWQSDDRLTESEGYWNEIFVVAPRRFETLFSSQNPTGAACLAQPFGEPVPEHNYWGGMRDRIADTHDADDPFDSVTAQSFPARRLACSRNRRISVAVPDNLCLIRSGQDLRACAFDEMQTYTDVVRPNLTAGMAYLRDNPIESRCLSCRLMDETEMDGTYASQSFGLAIFASLTDLEIWSKSHQSHLAIFGSFFRMVEHHQGQLNLRLWHEVLIIDKAGSLCEYVNCHPNTGLLPWFS